MFIKNCFYKEIQPPVVMQHTNLSFFKSQIHFIIWLYIFINLHVAFLLCITLHLVKCSVLGTLWYPENMHIDATDRFSVWVKIKGAMAGLSLQMKRGREDRQAVHT